MIYMESTICKERRMYKLVYIFSSLVQLGPTALRFIINVARHRVKDFFVEYDPCIGAAEVAAMPPLTAACMRRWQV